MSWYVAAVHELHRLRGTTTRPWGPATAVWALSWGVMLSLDGRIDVANMALILVLSAAVAAVWSAPWASLAASAIAVMAFNVAFVPPRGAFTVDLRQHALLLATMLTVSWIVTLLMARLRWHAAQATAHATRSDQLRWLGDALRAADSQTDQAAALRDALSKLGGGDPTLLLPGGPGDGSTDGGGVLFVGPATPDEATCPCGARGAPKVRRSFDTPLARPAPGSNTPKPCAISWVRPSSAARR